MPAQTVIVSHQNSRVKQLRAAFANQSPDGHIAVEGEHLIAEALNSGVRSGVLYVSQSAALPSALRRALTGGVEVIALSDEVFCRAAATETPQGIALLFTPPTPAARPGPALLLVAAGVQDPGNLGTLIRSAEAFGATAVLSTPGTVSPWNQKVIRASAGSIFRMPVQLAQTMRQLDALKHNGIEIFAAVAEGGIAPQAAPLASPCAILIGNEGAGLPTELLDLADARITIPTPGNVESLNAAIAGSLLLYEASRQRTAS